MTTPLRRPPAVVLAASTNGLGTVRSLRLARVPTIVVAADAAEPAMHSRYPLEKFVIGEGDLDTQLLECLRRLAVGRPVLVPTSDKFVTFMTRHRSLLQEQFRFCLPDDELIDVLIDKSRETRLIAELGIPLPRTIQELPASADELVALAGLPLIIKPHSFKHVHTLGKKNELLWTRADAEAFYRRRGNRLAGLLAQEIIPGADDTLWVCNCTFGPSCELHEAFTFRRLGLSPPHFGVTSYAVSERNRQVVDLVARLGPALKYTGPAMAEFKFDSRDGLYKYIEVNPRFGACNYFDTRCGINNVHNAYRLALGEPLGEGSDHQVEGTMYLSLYDDLYSRWKDGQRVSSALRYYARHVGRRHVGAYFEWGDWRPSLMAAARHTTDTLRSIGRKTGILSAAGRAPS
jgi:predicted ATP-grasp superfamily ATP-dependent carboligase